MLLPLALGLQTDIPTYYPVPTTTPHRVRGWAPLLMQPIPRKLTSALRKGCCCPQGDSSLLESGKNIGSYRNQEGIEQAQEWGWRHPGQEPTIRQHQE